MEIRSLINRYSFYYNDRIIWEGKQKFWFCLDIDDNYEIREDCIYINDYFVNNKKKTVLGRSLPARIDMSDIQIVGTAYCLDDGMIHLDSNELFEIKKYKGYECIDFQKWINERIIKKILE